MKKYLLAFLLLLAATFGRTAPTVDIEIVESIPAGT
jgi:hypothetical protein